MTAGAELDLRFTGSLDPDASVVFNAVAREMRGAFNDVVARLSEPLRDSIDWWVEGPASRNTYASPFFHHFCALHLVRRLIDEDRFAYDRVRVDSREMQRLVERLLRDAGLSDRPVEHVPDKPAKRVAKRIAATPVLTLRLLRQWRIGRSTRESGTAPLPARPLVLVDTFMMPDYTASDRWYGRLWSSLTSAQAGETFFVPTLVQTPLNRAGETFRALRSGDRNFLIKEDYLELSDILFAAGHRGRVARLPIPAVETLGYNLAPLAREELLNNSDPLSPLDALLTYRFVARLRERGISVRLALDWFEGHGIDKAWNLAFRRFFPDTTRVGYRAFESFAFYLSTYPTSGERDAGVIPDAIAVQGPASVDGVREFLPDLSVIVVPALRTQYLWEADARRSQSDAPRILVALPISTSASLRIMRQVLEAHNRTTGSQRRVHYVIKRHPATPLRLLTEHLPDPLPDGVTFTNEPSFPKLIADADVLVSEASSVCLEALACGVPVIVMENDAGLTYDPMPNAIPGELYRRVRSGEQLSEAVLHYADLSTDARERQRALGLEIRAGYFERLTHEGINRFMHVNTVEEPANA